MELAEPVEQIIIEPELGEATEQTHPQIPNRRKVPLSFTKLIYIATVVIIISVACFFAFSSKSSESIELTTKAGKSVVSF